MWLRLEALISTVGRVPSQHASDYLSPSAWSSTGALAEKLDEIKQSQTIQSICLESYNTKTTLTMQQHVKVSCEDFYQCLDSFKTAFISATRGLAGHHPIQGPLSRSLSSYQIRCLDYRLYSVHRRLLPRTVESKIWGGESLARDNSLGQKGP